MKCLGAAGKAATLGGCKSLYRQLLDSDGEHIHCSGREQTEICVDVKAMAAWGRKKNYPTVGTTWVASKLGGLNIMNCLQPRKHTPA